MKIDIYFVRGRLGNLMICLKEIQAVLKTEMMDALHLTEEEAKERLRDDMARRAVGRQGMQDVSDVEIQ